MPLPQDGFNFVIAAFVIAVIGAFVFARWAKKRQDATGQHLPVFWISLGAIIVLPVLVYLLAGAPLNWDYPSLKGFNFRGGFVVRPEFLALWLALTLYTSAFIAEIVRAGILAIDKGQWEASLAVGITRARTLNLVIIPQAMRVIVPPLTSQYLNLTKKLVSGDRHWLYGCRGDGWRYYADADGQGDGDDDHRHRVLSGCISVHFIDHELVQRTHQAGRKIGGEL